MMRRLLPHRLVSDRPMEAFRHHIGERALKNGYRFRHAKSTVSWTVAPGDGVMRG
jgi:hypothetical protein